MQRLLDIIPSGVTRIDLLAPPFSGHLHPVLAMGRALSVGYQVRIICTKSVAARVQAAGLCAMVLDTDFDTPLQPVINPQYAVRSHPLKLYRQFRAVVNLLGDFADELEQRWRREGEPDLAIADFTLPVVGAVCQRLNIPWWTSLPSPCVLETPDGVPAYCGGLMPAEGLFQHFWQGMHRVKVRLFKRVVFWLFRGAIRRTGMQQLYRADGSESAYSSERILALSERAFEFPRTWPTATTFIGPALYTPPISDITPPFTEGRRHVLVTLGTHLDWHKDAVANAVIKLARTMPDWEFHFTDGWPAGERGEHQENFHRIAWIDYDRWLPRYDAVIHHGGAGIMWHCLLQRIPALVYPVDYDQFDHAARLHYSGKAQWLKGGISALENARPQLLQILDVNQQRQ